MSILKDEIHPLAESSVGNAAEFLVLKSMGRVNEQSSWSKDSQRTRRWDRRAKRKLIPSVKQLWTNRESISRSRINQLSMDQLIIQILISLIYQTLIHITKPIYQCLTIILGDYSL